MKKLILFCIFAMLISCNERVSLGNNYHDGPTIFIVKDIQSDKSLVNMNIYTVEIVDLNGFSYDRNNSQANLELTFTDFKNKFVLGQPISFGDIK